jgi:hypothetical protein
MRPPGGVKRRLSKGSHSRQVFPGALPHGSNRRRDAIVTILCHAAARPPPHRHGGDTMKLTLLAFQAGASETPETPPTTRSYGRRDWFEVSAHDHHRVALIASAKPPRQFECQKSPQLSRGAATDVTRLPLEWSPSRGLPIKAQSITTGHQGCHAECCRDAA